MKRRLLKVTRTKQVELSEALELQQLLVTLRRSAKGSTVYKTTLDNIKRAKFLLDQLPAGEGKERRRADIDKVVERIEALQETKLGRTRRLKLPIKEKSYHAKKQRAMADADVNMDDVPDIAGEEAAKVSNEETNVTTPTVDDRADEKVDEREKRWRKLDDFARQGRETPERMEVPVIDLRPSDPLADNFNETMELVNERTFEQVVNGLKADDRESSKTRRDGFKTVFSY